MSYATVQSCTVHGVGAISVSVEVHIAGGLPSVSLVGLPQSAVRESKDRVRAAIQNAGFDFPLVRVTVNLAPADLPKQGGRFDLPIALGIMLAKGYLPPDSLNNFCVIGELGLSGELRSVSGVLPSALALRNSEVQLLCPEANAKEAAQSSSTNIVCAANLSDVIHGLRSSLPEPSANTRNRSLRHWSEPQKPLFAGVSSTPQILSAFELQPQASIDFADIKGHAVARRVLEICAAGGHHLLMLGSPGTGKSMLATRLATVLPPMSTDEALQTASIVSVSRGGFSAQDLWQRPFRAPHHTSTVSALIGGGAHPMPGEISLAHNGVLFLDEMAEFPRRVLDSLREPLETGTVSLSRAGRRAEYPTRFQLVAASNLCPCGYFGDLERPCRCTDRQVLTYRSRLSGPLLDRIDLQLHVPRIGPDTLLDQTTGESSAAIQARVVACRARQLTRQGCVNQRLPPSVLNDECLDASDIQQLLRAAASKLQLSQRALHSVLRVARTIADLACCDHIAVAHITEALSYRLTTLSTDCKDGQC